MKVTYQLQIDAQVTRSADYLGHERTIRDVFEELKSETEHLHVWVSAGNSTQREVQAKIRVKAVTVEP